MIIVSRLMFVFMPSWVAGITIWPFIFLRNKTLVHNNRIVNHESIHLRQQTECGFIGLILVTVVNLILGFEWYRLIVGACLFYILYIYEFAAQYIKYRSWIEAYRHIYFEIEAYRYENDTTYLGRRKFLAFVMMQE